MQMEKRVDQLVMLLSTDWFFPYWPVIGLWVELPSRQRLQQQCRRITAQFMAGEDQYWWVSASAGRLQQTRDALQTAVVAESLPAGTLLHWPELLAGKTRMLNSYSNWLTCATEALFDQGVSQLSLCPEDACMLEHALLNYGAQRVDFEQLAISSSTLWDDKIRRQTADLPTHLTDYFGFQDDAQGWFASFWLQVQQSLSPDGVTQLQRCYCSWLLEQGVG